MYSWQANAGVFAQQAFLESYLELAPDGEYLEMDEAQAPVVDDSYLGMLEHLDVATPPTNDGCR